MTLTFAQQLRAEAARLEPQAQYSITGEFTEPLERLSQAEQRLSEAWSGSNLGYHSCVYYTAFERPPPGAHFSSEWGLMGVFQGSTGGWVEFPREEVRREVRQRAGDPSTELPKVRARETRDLLDDVKASVVSILSAFLAYSEDQYIGELHEKAKNVSAPTEAEVRNAVAALQGQVMTRDTVALGQGFHLAPHQEVRVEAMSIRAPFEKADELRHIALRAADHIDRLAQRPEAFGDRQRGTRVFLGHGRSPQWRDLKDFVSERLGLPYDEFNRVPVAGTTNIDRLSQMLNNAAVAFLVLTAEDERADGDVVARQNVVHEAGLFQGRLGFARAIVMLEDGCEPFSNVDGLGQIRFPQANISAEFEEVRRVLEREGLVPTRDGA